MKGLLCNTCSTYATKGTRGSDIWITSPCTRIRRESMTDHEKSSVHQKSKKAEADANILVNTGAGQIERSLSILCKTEFDE